MVAMKIIAIAAVGGTAWLFMRPRFSPVLPPNPPGRWRDSPVKDPALLPLGNGLHLDMEVRPAHVCQLDPAVLPALAKPVLDQVSDPGTDTATKYAIWSEYVGIASAIIDAHDIHLVEDEAKIYDDLQFGRLSVCVNPGVVKSVHSLVL